MKQIVVAVLLVALLGACVTSPAISKSSMGNCQIEVIVPEDLDVRRAQIYVDDVFIGNATDSLPVLLLRRGKHTIRAEMPGCRTVEVSVTILGEPNHQVINIFLERETG